MKQIVTSISLSIVLMLSSVDTLKSYAICPSKTKTKKKLAIIKKQLESSTLTAGYKSMLLQQQKQLEGFLECVPRMADQPIKRAKADTSQEQIENLKKEIIQAQNHNIAMAINASQSHGGPAHQPYQFGSKLWKLQQTEQNQNLINLLNDLLKSERQIATYFGNMIIDEEAAQ